MRIQPLHEAFLQALNRELPDWKFVSAHRDFRKPFAQGNWLAHLAFVNHAEDFDAMMDVAVEFVHGGNRLCIVGASLGNIEGAGQVRYSVSSEAEAGTSAAQAAAHLRSVGLPFLEHYSDAANVVRCLRMGGAEALLISPLQQVHEQQIRALEKLGGGV